MPRLPAELVSGEAGRADELDLVSRNILILSDIPDEVSSGFISVRVKKTSLPRGENVPFKLS